jgi:ribosomal-protein-alanine N-acetyltransferase
VPFATSLATQRTELRPLTTADLDRAHALWTDASVRRYLWDDLVISRETAADVLRASDADFARRGFGLWGVYDRATGGLAGFCGCRSSEAHAPELMYGLLPAWWGRGLAVDASAAVLDHVLLVLDCPEVVAATDPPNAASIRVMEKLGMTFERRGTLNGLDTLFYRLSRETWRRVRSGDAGGASTPG